MARPSLFAAIAAGALVVCGFATTDSAHAARRYSVEINSNPSGATIYVGTKDSEPIGQTPLTTKLESGRHTIILDLDGYQTQVRDVHVKKVRKAQKHSFDLKRSDQATLEIVAVDGAAQVEGAKVLVDGEDVGNLPDTIKIEAGPHQVEVIKEGYETFETWIEVEDSAVASVEVALVALPGTAAVGSKGSDSENPDGLKAEGKVELPSLPSGPTGTVPRISLGAGVEVGGRSFEYQNPTMGNLRPYEAGGVPLLRVDAEISPLANSPNPLLNGWVLYAGYGMSTPLDSSAKVNEGQADEAVVNVPTTWTELDAALGYVYRFPGTRTHAGAHVGYGVHTYTFDYAGAAMPLEGTIPDVTYEFVAFGADARVSLAPSFAILASGEVRIVQDTGDIATRFKESTVTAFGANAGLAYSITRMFEARLGARFDSYTHTFVPQDVAPVVAADGGTDRYISGTLSLVFTY